MNFLILMVFFALAGLLFTGGHGRRESDEEREKRHERQDREYRELVGNWESDGPPPPPGPDPGYQVWGA